MDWVKLTKRDPVVSDTEGEESVPCKLDAPDKVDSGAHHPGDVLEKGGQAVSVGAQGQQRYLGQFPSNNVMNCNKRKHDMKYTVTPKYNS